MAILQVAIATGYSDVSTIDDFEGSSNTTWASQAGSEIDTMSPESGKDSHTGLKWTFRPDGVNRYGNEIVAAFAPVDASQFKALRFDFKIHGPNAGRIGCQRYSSSENKAFDLGDINQLVGEDEWSEVVLALPAGITTPIDGMRLFYDGIAYNDSAGLVCQADNFRLDSDDSVAPPVAPPPLANPGVAFSSLPANEQTRLRRATAPKPLAERVNPYSTPMYYPMWGGSSPDGTQRSDLQEALIREFAELGMSKIHFYAYPDGVGATNTADIHYSVSPANKLGIEELVRICKQYGVKIGLRVDLPYVRVPEWDRPGLDPAVSYWLCNPRNPDNQLAQYAGWLKEMVTLLQGNLEYIVIGDEVSDYDIDRTTFLDGVAWNGTYGGDALPSASMPAWSIYANSGMWSGSISNGIYTHRTMLTSAGAWQVGTGFDNPLSTKRTVEVKVKLGIDGSYPSAGDGVVDLLLFGGSRYIELRIGTNSISMKGTSTSSAGLDMLSSFNTIRLTHDSSLSTDAWKLYLNSNATPIITSGSDPGVALGSPFHAVVFGDPSTGGIGGESQWDYISWTDAGAFDPVAMAWTKEDQLAVLKECSEAIREVDRDVLVSGFAASSGKIDDVITLVQMGYGDFANAVAINHYDYTVAPEFLRKLKEAGGKDFPLLSNGVGYISSDTPLRNPPQDPYSRYNDEDQASMIARTMYSWWDNGAQAAPYYVCLRTIDYKGEVQVMWYGFFGFMDFIVDENEKASFKRYPGWYAYRTVANIFDDRPSFKNAAFKVTASKPEKLYLKAFEREGKDLTLMIWREDRRQTPVDITIESGSYKYPVQIDLMDQDKLTDVAYEAPGGQMTLKNVPTGFRPTIIRLFHE